MASFSGTFSSGNGVVQRFFLFECPHSKIFLLGMASFSFFSPLGMASFKDSCTRNGVGLRFLFSKRRHSTISVLETASFYDFCSRNGVILRFLFSKRRRSLFSSRNGVVQRHFSSKRRRSLFREQKSKCVFFRMLPYS